MKPIFEYPIKFDTDWFLNSVAAMVFRPLERTMPIGMVERDETGAREPAWGGNFYINWGGSEFPCWTAYTVDIAEAGPHDFTFRFTSPAGPGGRDYPIYRLLLDDKEVAGPIRFNSKAEAGRWEHTAPSIPLPAGVHVLKVVNDNYSGGGLDWIRTAKPMIGAAKGSR
jgi:hypothetical protein